MFPVFLIGLPSVCGMMTSQGWWARPGRESGDGIHFLWDVFWLLLRKRGSSENSWPDFILTLSQAGTKHLLLLKACVEHAQKWAGQWEDSRSDTFLFVICLRDRRLLRREENHLNPYCVHTFICRNIFKPHCCFKIRRFPFLPSSFPSFLRKDHIQPSVHVLLFKKKRNMTTCQVPCHMPVILALGWRI